MNEVWKDIKGYGGLYQISNNGQVKSLARQYHNHTKKKGDTILVQSKNTRGYPIVSLANKSSNRTIRVHCLVWDAFGDRVKLNGEQIDHIDNNKTNNNIENLRLVNNRENCIKRSSNLAKTSIYNGVRLCKTGLWQAYYYINGKQKHLGCHKTELEAHNAYLDFERTI